MELSTKFKEAFKLALAFAIVYGIALKVNWLSPSWAGWSVVAIAATSGAESLAKGFLRIWGTLLACVVGLAIISFGAQDRWLFAFLTSAWLFFASYKMLSDKKISYFWFCAAYVCLVITAAGPSSAGGFYIAVFRTIETIMGIVVYTLISVLIWPQSNMGAIKKALSSLFDTQINFFKGLHQTFHGTVQLDQLRKLDQQQVQQLEAFSQSLVAEGSENYKVQELLPLWNTLEKLNTTLIKSLGRLIEGLEDLSSIKKLEQQPEIDRYFHEINERFTAMSNLLSGNSNKMELADVNLESKPLTGAYSSHFDKAALTIILSELNNIGRISKDMVNVANGLTNDSVSDKNIVIKSLQSKKTSEFKFPVINIEYLKGAFYVGAVVMIGFVIWFYVNPPGHSTWYIMGGVFALLFAGAQQVKTVKLIIPFMIAMFLASLVYVFVLPKLTMFYQLGLVLFACMFIIQYFLSGPATAIFTIAVIQLIAVNNPQSFDASALLNGFVFVSMLMIYLFGMSYLINSPRPEKKLLALTGRFFSSMKYLISQQSDESKRHSFLLQYRIAFHKYELHHIPPKIRAWGKAVDNQLFSNTDDEKIAELVTSLEMLVVRMETLMEMQKGGQKSTVADLTDTISNLEHRLERTFQSWDSISKTAINGETIALVSKVMEDFENKLKDIIAKNEKRINENEGIQFYRILGSYRGLMEATLSFSKVADKIDWKQMKEERFQ